MEPLPKARQNPEKAIQRKICDRLRREGWYVLETHGNMYQSGFPDVYATHSVFKARWIEVKLPNMKGSRFTNAQLDTFPKLMANGTRIWILTGSDDREWAKLMRAPNAMQYMIEKI